ncbi:menaquinone-dependent protoporphyrinogen IX dehydrogenase [Enterococcus faecalis]|uniref:menaquinone-dependent protoporphyrinogen IX dehydrogenase n=1 Tax=Enterococcus faecalis TaxID=1351 RepID=UPI0040420AEC
MRYLIIYSTINGQSKKIANKIADNLRNKHVVFVANLMTIDTEKLLNVDKVLIGASVRYGRFSRKLLKFVISNKYFLESKNTCFFGVNLIARDPNKRNVESNIYVRKFLAKTNWKPQLVGIFAGKLDYPKYNFFDRSMIRLIMKITHGETDISKTIEYTDWREVNRFSDSIS